MFIGREAELKFLEDKYQEDRGQLIVLYGRRRVGKTETLREFCKDKPHVFYSCTQSTDKVQLVKFSQLMLKENIPARNYITEFADWEKAFHSILDLPYGDRKKLIVIDEFPYMCKGNDSIPSILQNLWESELKDGWNTVIALAHIGELVDDNELFPIAIGKIQDRMESLLPVGKLRDVVPGRNILFQHQLGELDQLHLVGALSAGVEHMGLVLAKFPQGFRLAHTPTAV